MAENLCFLYNSLVDGGTKTIEFERSSLKADVVYAKIAEKEGLDQRDFRVTLDGKPIESIIGSNNVRGDSFVQVRLHSNLLGGKGGFGSMLRAIGAQIEKTTNKEACRDLSGRRLRDINAEKRIKEWISQKANRQEEEEKKKKEKLLKLTEEPKIEFKDDEYFQTKEEIPEVVEDALKYGLKLASRETKESSETKTKSAPNKPGLWLGVDLDEDEDDDNVEASAAETKNLDEPSTSGVKRSLDDVVEAKRQKCC